MTAGRAALPSSAFALAKQGWLLWRQPGP
jgi:hypothetical protein